MNIIYEPKNEILFGDLKIGDVFKDKSNDKIYMKTNCIDVEDKHLRYNAVCLENGIIEFFLDQEYQILLDCYLVIKY